MIPKMKNYTVFASIPNKEKRKFKKNYRKQSNATNIPFDIWEDTEGWEEPNAKLEEKNHELSRRLELSLGFGELRERWAIPKEIKSGKKLKNQNGKKKLGGNYPQF